MVSTAAYFGGFIRWLLKGCKTKLQDELEGNLNATWGRSYDFENYIIGVFTVAIIFGAASFVFYLLVKFKVIDL